MIRRRLSLLALLLAAAVAVAGCGGDDDSSAKGGDAPAADDGGSAGAGDADDADDSGDSGDGSGDANAGDCGPHEVNGVTVMTHCGPASAEVVVGGETLTFEGGSCQQGDTFFTINVGTQVLGIEQDAVEQDYFGVAAGELSSLGEGSEAVAAEPVTGDGPYSGDILITWVLGDVAGSVMDDDAEITFSDGLTKGTFSGTGSLGAEGQVTGSFDCG